MTHMACMLATTVYAVPLCCFAAVSLTHPTTGTVGSL